MEEKLYTEKELTEAFRIAMEDRGTWFYLLLKAAKKQGADIEKMAEEAITEFGVMKGRAIGEAKTPGELAIKLSSGHSKNIYDIDRVQIDENKAVLNFKYCAIVEAWKKLGCSKEEIALLCKLARNSDLGIVSCSPELKLEFPKLLSEGDDYCQLVFTKK